LIHVNIQSIKNKIDRVEAFSKLYSPEILCFSEHWLKPYETNLVKLEGYQQANNFCRESFSNGGVIIFTKDGLASKPHPSVNKLVIEKDIELTAIDLNYNNTHYTIVCVYRSPSGNFKTFLDNIESLLSSLTKTKNTIIIVGDFNVNFSYNCKNAAILIDIFKSYGLSMKITGPTRITNTSSNCIDNIFTSDDTDFASSIDAGLSDHSVQLLYVISLIKPKPINKNLFVNKRSFSKQQIDEFCIHLSSTSWQSILDKNNVNEMFDEFLNIFNKIFNIAFPLKKRRIRNQINLTNEWYTPEVKDKSIVVIQLYIKSKSPTGNDNDTKIYLETLQEYKTLISENKKKTNIKKIKRSSNKSKSAWNLIHNHKNDSSQDTKDTITIVHNNIEITSPIEIANIFNVFFKNAASNLLISFQSSSNCNSPNTCPSYSIQSCNKSFFLSPVSTKEFLDTIDLVTKKKSAGSDGVPCHILKYCATYLTKPLIFIINESFSSGVFPNALKKAVIQPLHKKGSKESIENYRPLAIVSIFSKIFEKLFCTKLISFLDKYSLISDSQHGFRKNRSTTTALLAFHNLTLEYLKKGHSTTGIFYDLSKAFDIINHKILLEKLTCFGVTGIPNNWIKSYLSDRSQVTKITDGNGSSISDEVLINIGVPQGSIIAPLLFILFTNDITSNINHGHLTLFADDTTYLTDMKDNNDTSIINIIQSDINATAHWMTKNDLVLNDSKTVLMQFDPKLNSKQIANPTFILNGNSILSKNSTKFLGVIIDNKLTWKEHINEVSKKMASGCFLIKRIMQICNLETAKLVYHAYVHSRIAYGIVLWGHSSHTIRLFKLQKRAIRYLAQANSNPCTAGMYRKDSCKPYFVKFEILTLPSLFIYNLISLIIDNIQKYPDKKDIHSHETRFNSTLKLDMKLSKFNKMDPSFNGITCYNKILQIAHLNLNIKNIPRFKSTVKKFLIENAFYSVNEFLAFK
jgi:hypothetical protein